MGAASKAGRRNGTSHTNSNTNGTNVSQNSTIPLPLCARRHPNPGLGSGITESGCHKAPRRYAPRRARWVGQRPGGQGRTLGDSSFLPWLGKQLAVHPVWPGSLVLQLREGDVLGRVDQLSAFGDALRDLEIRIALEHFGASTDADTRRMLAEMRPDYVKIARELTVGLHHSATPSLRLNGLLGQAKEVGAYTMASYVEDADGLALLWQAQIDLVQGNFIRQPEEELRYELEFPGLDDAG
nr:EAL domain-containing protein [Thioalkalivibrio sp. AKL10]